MSGGRRLLMGPLHLVARLESTYHIIMVVTFIDDPQIKFDVCAVRMRICNVRAQSNTYSSSRKKIFLRSCRFSFHIWTEIFTKTKVWSTTKNCGKTRMRAKL